LAQPGHHEVGGGQQAHYPARFFWLGLPDVRPDHSWLQ